jgi:hypothetical protein
MKVLALRGIVALCLVLGWSAGAGAQCFRNGVDEEYPCRFTSPRWSGELASLGANALVGALTAGLTREFRDGDFSDGFTRGALGGVITYAGKRLAAEDFTTAGLFGRQIAAVGASATRNAAAAQPSFERLTLPLGPVWLDVRRGERTHLAARVDPAALAWIVYGITERELDVDIGESLSAGAAVFRTNGKLLSFGNDSVHAAGVTNAGVVFLAQVPAYGEAARRRTETHERIHVIQEDQFTILWTAPLGEWAMGRTSLLARVAPHVVINLSTEVFRLLAPMFATHEDRPWELESIFHAR